MKLNIIKITLTLATIMVSTLTSFCSDILEILPLTIKRITVSISLADLGMISKTFDKIQMQIAGGSDVALITSYSGNSKFEKGPLVSIPELNANSGNVQIYPNPAKDRTLVNCMNGLKQIEVYNLLGTKLISRNLDGETICSLSKYQLNSGLFILKITDSMENKFIRKLIFE